MARQDPRNLLGWLFILVGGAFVLLSAFVWTVASIRTPDAPATAGEERDIGFFDPHIHVRMQELTAFGEIPEMFRPPAGYRRWAVRLQARSTAVEDFADPSRLSVTVRAGGSTFPPLTLAVGPAEIDSVTVRRRFSNVLEAGELQQAWFLFDLPETLSTAEVWLSRDSWLASILPGWESTPLHDKAVLALPLGPEVPPNSP